MKLTKSKIRRLIIESLNESFEKGMMTTGFFGSMRSVSKEDVENFVKQLGEHFQNAFGYIDEIDNFLNNIKSALQPAAIQGSKKDFYFFARNILSQTLNLKQSSYYPLQSVIPELFLEYYKKAFGEDANIYIDSFNNAYSNLISKIKENEIARDREQESIQRGQDAIRGQEEKERLLRQQEAEKEQQKADRLAYEEKMVKLYGPNWRGKSRSTAGTLNTSSKYIP